MSVRCHTQTPNLIPGRADLLCCLIQVLTDDNSRPKCAVGVASLKSQLSLCGAEDMQLLHNGVCLSIVAVGLQTHMVRGACYQLLD